jgi:hypothetical protein
VNGRLDPNQLAGNQERPNEKRQQYQDGNRKEKHQEEGSYGRAGEDPAPAPQEEKNLKPASWLIARVEEALYRSQPAMKEAKTLQGVSTSQTSREPTP